MEKEENRDLDDSLSSLQEKRTQQEKLLKRKLREHNACLREIIFDIDRLEDLTKKQVDPNTLKSIILSCPIDLQIPIRMGEKDSSIDNEASKRKST